MTIRINLGPVAVFTDAINGITVQDEAANSRQSYFDYSSRRFFLGRLLNVLGGHRTGTDGRLGVYGTEQNGLGRKRKLQLAGKYHPSRVGDSYCDHFETSNNLISRVVLECVRWPSPQMRVQPKGMIVFAKTAENIRTLETELQNTQTLLCKLNCNYG